GRLSYSLPYAYSRTSAAADALKPTPSPAWQYRQLDSGPCSTLHRHLPRLHGEGAWAFEGDVAAVQHDFRLARLDDDAALGEDIDPVVVGGHRDAAVGEHLQGAIVGLEAQRTVARDDLDRAALCKEGDVAAADADDRVAGGEVGVLLGGQVGMAAGVGNRTGRSCKRDGVGRFGDQDGRGEPLDGVAAVTLAVRRLGGRLAVDGGGVSTVLLRVDEADQVGLARVCVRRLDARCFRGVAQSLRRANGTLQLADGLGDVELGRGHGRSRRRRQQHALARPQVGPTQGGQVETFAAVAAPRIVAVLDQIAELQTAVGQAGMQALAQLAGGVVDHPLLGAAAIVRLAVQSRQAAAVVAALGKRERWGDLAVVELAGGDGLIYGAVGELDEDFAADPRQQVGAPIGAGLPLGHPHPRAGGVVAGRV